MTAADRIEARIARVEAALAEQLYMTHGPHGLPSLYRQAPHAAALLEDYLAATVAVDDAHFVGRKSARIRGGVMAASNDSDRLVAIEQELARLRSERDQAAQDDARKREAEIPPAPRQPQEGWVGEQLRRQEAARQERARLHDEWAARWEAQLTRVRPKLERLEAELRDLDTRRSELERCHAAAVAKLDVERRKIDASIASLTAAPPMPTRDLEKAVPFDAAREQR